MTSAMNLRMSAPLRHGSGSALASRAESDLLHTWRPHHRSLGRAGRMRHCGVEAEARREGDWTSQAHIFSAVPQCLRGAQLPGAERWQGRGQARANRERG